MDLITSVPSIKGVTNLTETIITSLCNFGTPDDPRIPSDEEKWAAIQRVASDLLKISDWTQLPDSGLSVSKQFEWQAYRDDLRSLQDDFQTPDSVVFPTQPAEE